MFISDDSSNVDPAVSDITANAYTDFHEPYTRIKPSGGKCTQFESIRTNFSLMITY